MHCIIELGLADYAGAVIFCLFDLLEAGALERISSLWYFRLGQDECHPFAMTKCRFVKTAFYL
jgi:hypothetical protein